MRIIASGRKYLGSPALRYSDRRSRDVQAMKGTRIAVGAATVCAALAAAGVTATSAASTLLGRAKLVTAALADRPADAGATLWVRRYAGRGSGVTGYAIAEATGAGGAAVYVTGTSTGVTSASQAVTIAYNAATGRRIWLRTYGPNGRDASAADVAVNPRTGTVYVTGQSSIAASGTGFARPRSQVRTLSVWAAGKRSWWA